MKLLNIAKYTLAIVAIGFLFVDWKIAIGIFILTTIIHTIPFGPNVLLNTITGYLIIGGLVSFFFDWRLAIALIVAGFLLAKFHVWGNKQNAEFYGKMLEKLPPSVYQDFAEIVNNEIKSLEEEGRVKSPYHKFVMQTENMSLMLWFLQWSNTFPHPVQEEIFYRTQEGYFSQLESSGISEKEIKEIRSLFNKTYATYNKLVDNGKPDNFSKINTHFAKSISLGAKTDFDATEATIPTALIERTKEKLAEYHKAISF